jgi:surfactin synthase thioesterase subunit
MIRELARLAALNLAPGEAAFAFLGGAVGGALAFVSLHLVNNRWPTLLDPIRPH